MIMKKGRAVIPGVLALLTGGIAGASMYLAFVFPKTLAVWENEGLTLSGFQILMANASSFCTHYGLLLLPVLLLGFLASLVWLILAVMTK